ncbi:hypothetical protein AZE42_09190 [Rhizopogon vesiculosus]|uniref:Uncharacterized protein n=1 Tax=Rhizopogon vesiculosus TaxID=180088 RepID=A0A1J8QWX3_9AGAM|nr:hypothetical protein AZE42_09190 [Rhizopogon vesiculosus]
MTEAMSFRSSQERWCARILQRYFRAPVPLKLTLIDTSASGFNNVSNPDVREGPLPTEIIPHECSYSLSLQTSTQAALKTTTVSGSVSLSSVYHAEEATSTPSVLSHS